MALNHNKKYLKIRSERVPKMYTPGMKKMLEEASSEPGKPISLAWLRDKHSLTRNDIINVRRQIEKIISMDGPIRYIEPDKSHVVYISDDIPTDQINAVLAAASAIAHLNCRDKLVSKSLPSDLRDVISQELTSTKRL